MINDNSNDLPADDDTPEAAAQAAQDAEADALRAAAEDAERDEASAEDGPDGETDEALVDIESELVAAKEQLLRALADAENTRRIAAREKADATRYAITNFARDLLGVADNLGMALMSVDADARKADPALDNLCVGVEMTQKELASTFERHGIESVAAEGAAFDHNVHEALQQVPNPDVPDGQVVQVIRSGYRIQGRLLRPAQVLVATGGPKPEKPEPAAAPDGGADGQKAYEGGETPPGSQIDQET